MATRLGAVLAVLFAALLAGCAEGKPPAATDGPAPDGSAAGSTTDGPADPEPERTGRGAEALEPTHRPEVLYTYLHLLRAQPDDRPLDGAGFGYDPYLCEADPASPATLPCWARVYTGVAKAHHVAGDPVRVVVWLQGATAMPVAADVWLETGGVRVAEGRTMPVEPLPGAPMLGAEGCVRAEAAMPLVAGIEATTGLALVVRVPGLFGAECQGGGEEGNRVEIGLA